MFVIVFTILRVVRCVFRSLAYFWLVCECCSCFFFSLPEERKGETREVQRRRRAKCRCLWCFQTVFAPFCQICIAFFTCQKSQKARCVRQLVRFCVGSFMFVQNTLSDVQIWRTEAPLHIYKQMRRVSHHHFSFSSGIGVLQSLLPSSGPASQEGAQERDRVYKGCAWGLGEITASEGLQTVSPHINRPCNSRN